MDRPIIKDSDSNKDSPVQIKQAELRKLILDPLELPFMLCDKINIQVSQEILKPLMSHVDSQFKRIDAFHDKIIEDQDRQIGSDVNQSV